MHKDKDRAKPFTFTICHEDYHDKLINFLDSHWKKDHIFTKNKELLDWQHKNENGHYNFIIALDEKDKILGIFGFIPTSHFSEDLKEHHQSWMVIWKIRDDCQLPGLGVGMLRYFNKLKGFDTVCAVGLSEAVKPLYKILKYEVGVLRHFVLFNRQLTSYKFVDPPALISCNLDSSNFKIEEMNEESLNALDIEDVRRLFFRHPIKDIKYLINRFLRHPVYQYKVFSIKTQSGSVLTLFSTRFIYVKNTTIARVVDFQGESLLSDFYNSVLIDWVAEMKIEYVDVMFYEENWELPSESCFIDIKDHEDLVIPNYFEPLVMKNVPLDFAFKTKKNGIFSIFKGDSDQDRPNIVP